MDARSYQPPPRPLESSPPDAVATRDKGPGSPASGPIDSTARSGKRGQTGVKRPTPPSGHPRCDPTLTARADSALPLLPACRSRSPPPWSPWSARQPGPRGRSATRPRSIRPRSTSRRPAARTAPAPGTVALAPLADAHLSEHRLDGDDARLQDRRHAASTRTVAPSTGRPTSARRSSAGRRTASSAWRSHPTPPATRTRSARRMGIMYLIYNDTIWSLLPRLRAAAATSTPPARRARSARAPCGTRTTCTSRSGTPAPRPRPRGTAPATCPRGRCCTRARTRSTPTQTAVTGLTVPATGAPVTSPFFLRAGVTYRVVATGTVRPAPAPATGDANCRPAADGFGLTPRGPRGPTSHRRRGRRVGLMGPRGQRAPDEPVRPPDAETRRPARQRRAALGGRLPGRPHLRGLVHPDDPPAPGAAVRSIATPADDAGSLTVYLARDDITAASLGG